MLLIIVAGFYPLMYIFMYGEWGTSAKFRNTILKALFVWLHCLILYLILYLVFLAITTFS